MDLLQHIQRAIRSDFLSPAGYFFWGWIGFYALVGVAASLRQQRRDGTHPLSLARALRFCFPKETFGGPSAKLDYKIILLSHYLLIYPIGLVLAAADLGWTVQHILFHRVSWLWEFHKVPARSPVICESIASVLAI